MENKHFDFINNHSLPIFRPVVQLLAERKNMCELFGAKSFILVHFQLNVLHSKGYF